MDTVIWWRHFKFHTINCNQCTCRNSRFAYYPYKKCYLLVKTRCRKEHWLVLYVRKSG